MLSMTGFGRARSGGVTVELRSVNHRFLDLVPHLPRVFSDATEDALQACRERLVRGHVDVCVYVDKTVTSGAIHIDDTRFLQLQDAARHLLSLTEGGVGLGPDLGPLPEHVQAQLLAWPGVMTLVEAQETGDVGALREALAAALDALVAMQTREGAALAEVLGGYVREITVHVEAIARAAHALPGRLLDEMRSRLESLVGGQVSEERLLTEAALLADRADISEEIERLRSHLSQFQVWLATDEPAGRKIGFLLQELGREVHTLGSKSVDLEVTKHVIEIKSLLERCREQAANVA